MNLRPGRKWLPALAVLMLAAGIFTPLAVHGQAGGSTQQQSQLAVLNTNAQSSKSYAHSTVEYAVENGLSVTAAQAQLGQGDSLLAAAQADAQSGTNPAEGIQSVEAAMTAYSGAAASASVAISDAGLAASVDYYAAVSSIAEVNATVEVAASVAAQACAGSAGSTPAAQALTQACAQVNVQVASARAQLSQAASLLVQSNGHVGTSVDVSQAGSFVAQARVEVQSCQSLLLTIASYSYGQRGQAYVQSVVEPLSAAANLTIRAEQSVLANLTSLQTTYETYVGGQEGAAQGVVSSASALGTAIAQVNTDAVSANAGAAESTEAELHVDLQALLTLPTIAALPGVVADIDTALSASTSFNSALASVNSWAGAFSQAELSDFGGFLGTWNGDAMSAQAAGENYLTSYQTVVSDLSVPALEALSQVQAVLSLPVSQTEGAAETSIQQATSAMATVQTDIAGLTSAVGSAQPSILVSGSTLSAAGTLSTQGNLYLNSTADAAMAEVAASVQATAQAAQAFITSAHACLNATVGAYAGSFASLETSGAGLGTQTQGSASAIATAGAYISSDSRIRTTEASMGEADTASALSLFASQDIPAGVAAMAQASIQFQAAGALG